MSDFGDGIDLESGTISIDMSAPEEQISTQDILSSTEATAETSLIAGNTGKIYILDLRPVFKAMGATAGDKRASSLVRFCETLLSRALGSLGTYNNHDDEQFLFQLKKSDGDGLTMASRIVNELGVNFLRDGFNAEELASEVLGVVDAANALDSNGRIIAHKALAATRLQATDSEDPEDDGPVWLPMSSEEEEEEALPEWQEVGVDERTAAERVKRGADRRARKLPIAGPDRREQNHGRRETDDPNVTVW